jgi:hypothetical protein
MRRKKNTICPAMSGIWLSGGWRVRGGMLSMVFNCVCVIVEHRFRRVQPHSRREINQSSLKIVSKKTTRLSIISANFRKNFQSQCDTRGSDGHWFLKNLKSKISCQTPFNACLSSHLSWWCVTSCPMAWVQHCIKLPGGGQPARPSQAYYGQKFTMPCLNCHLFTHGGAAWHVWHWTELARSLYRPCY